MDQRLRGRRRFAAQLALRLMLWRWQAYQPVIVADRKIAAGRRGSEPRVQAVLQAAEELGARTVVDLGCAEGYFVRRCAEQGLLSIGVDGDARRLAVAQLSTVIDGVDAVGFVKSSISVDSLLQLPSSDLVVCLSVLHHVMYESGLEYARDLLRSMRRMARRGLVFEMGQSNELAFSWASNLPDMGVEPHDWIAELLASAGFISIRKVVEVESLNSSVRRAVFVAEPE